MGVAGLLRTSLMSEQGPVPAHSVLGRIAGRMMTLPRPSVIFDFSRRLPHGRRPEGGRFRPPYRVDVDKENESWRLITARPRTGPIKFLDVGGREGGLKYLFEGNMALGRRLPDYRQRRKWFQENVDYWNADLEQSGSGQYVHMDVCLPMKQWPADSRSHCGSFDVVYSNNVFEHLAEPWTAAENLVELLKPEGIVITIAPFSLRYHEVPGDYFRYTHTGLEHLFLRTGKMRTVALGYDMRARRVNWQGVGDANDICPEDRFGAWRENWFVFHAAERHG